MQAHDNNKELSREEFYDEMTRFEETSLNEIMDVLQENKHILSVEVLGLIGVVRILIDRYGDEYLKDAAVSYLKTPVHKKNDVVEE
jgi:hypothetical protein